MTYSIDEIKKLRAGIRPGEWGHEFIASSAIVDQLLEEIQILQDQARSDWNGNIIVNQNLEIERLNALITEMQIQHSKGHYTPLHEAERQRLKAENEQMKAELAVRDQLWVPIQDLNGSGWEKLKEATEEIERLKAELESAQRVGAQLVARDHQPCKEMLFASQLRAQAAEDVAKRISPLGCDVAREIEKRIAEMKGEKKS